MHRMKFTPLMLLAVTLGCTQTRTSTITETYQDSTLPEGTKQTMSLRLGNKTYVTEKVGPNPIVQLDHGNFANDKGLFVVSNDQQVSYEGSGTVAEVRGNSNVVSLPGTWTFISVSGHDNVIKAHAIDAVILTGNANTIQWKKLIHQANQLQVSGEGNDNTVMQIAD